MRFVLTGRFILAVMVSSCVLTLTLPPTYVDAAHAHNDGAGRVSD